MANSSSLFSLELAQQLHDSSDPFPASLEQAWQWLGYASKQKAKDKLVRNFQEGFDYCLNQMVESVNHAGLSAQAAAAASRQQPIFLTVDCFKMMAMMAGTEQGATVRQYFLQCEQKSPAS